MTKKITGPPTTLSGPFQLDNPTTMWWVNGVAYTLVVDGTPDTAYTAAVTALKAEAAQSAMHTNVAQDAADPNRLNYFSAAA